MYALQKLILNNHVSTIHNTTANDMPITSVKNRTVTTFAHAPLKKSKNTE